MDAESGRWDLHELEQFVRYQAPSAWTCTGSTRSTPAGIASAAIALKKPISITIGSSTRHAAMSFALILNASRNIRLRGLLSRRVLGEEEATSIAPEAWLIDPGAKPEEGAGKPPPLAGRLIYCVEHVAVVQDNGLFDYVGLDIQELPHQ